MSFFRKKTEPTQRVTGKPEFIIAGLGNPGKEYEYSRHNTGFLCLDILCNTYRFKTDRIKYQALTALADIEGHICLVMRPQTYMNNSGVSIKAAADFYKIPPENIIVIYDDISLATGVLRIRLKGSAGGHNGVKSIIWHLNTDVFPRLKIGVGEKRDPDDDLKDHVLGRFSKEDLETIRKTGERAVAAIALIVQGKTDEAMNKYNG
ncbi:MAG: aminoacyl-tRNA hydrolase [Clostridia bacterium]|nr:aminoacyl-tRNA hydrolase [Clostridia bacterium]MBQ9507660.1 aminoacyl-tRNA hydrolase [Clostridia bacterium]